MLRKMTGVAKGELGLEEWMPLLGTYSLKDKVGMGIACVTLRSSILKGIYVRHIQWDSMRRVPTAWDNLY